MYGLTHTLRQVGFYLEQWRWLGHDSHLAAQLLLLHKAVVLKAEREGGKPSAQALSKSVGHAYYRLISQRNSYVKPNV